MRFTVPTYISIEANDYNEARDLVQEMLRYHLVFQRWQGRGLSWTVGHAILGEWNPSEEKPVGRPREEITE